MGKPVKITDKGKSWNKSGRNASDKFASKKLRKRILIVCEGEKTEPNYFKSIRNSLPPGVATVDVVGLGMNTLSLVEEAKYRRDIASVPYVHVWVVFDRDSFDPSDFDNAIHKAKSEGMNAAWSNEAFELWYLLHFKDLKTGIRRTRFQGKRPANPIWVTGLGHGRSGVHSGVPGWQQKPPCPPLRYPLFSLPAPAS